MNQELQEEVSDTQTIKRDSNEDYHIIPRTETYLQVQEEKKAHLDNIIAMAATIFQMTVIGIIVLLWATGVQSAPARREAGTMNTCSDDGFAIDSNRSTADRLYDAIYITRKLSKVTILNKTNDMIPFYQSVQRIAESILSSKLNEEPGITELALREVLTQLVKDSCSWAVENAKEAVLEVDCNNITNISNAMEQYKNQLVQTLVQKHLDKSISLETVSLTIQLLPEIDDMEDRLSEKRSYGTIGNNRKAWVAEFISEERRHLVCSLL